jgi:hypothetical protein
MHPMLKDSGYVIEEFAEAELIIYISLVRLYSSYRRLHM